MLGLKNQEFQINQLILLKLKIEHKLSYVEDFDFELNSWYWINNNHARQFTRIITSFLIEFFVFPIAWIKHCAISSGDILEYYKNVKLSVLKPRLVILVFSKLMWNLVTNVYFMGNWAFLLKEAPWCCVLPHYCHFFWNLFAQYVLKMLIWHVHIVIVQIGAGVMPGKLRASVFFPRTQNCWLQFQEVDALSWPSRSLHMLMFRYTHRKNTNRTHKIKHLNLLNENIIFKKKKHEKNTLLQMLKYLSISH